MPQDYSYEKRRSVVGAVAAVIIAVYLIRLFTLQLMSDDYRKSADSNAFRKEIIYPLSRSHHGPQWQTPRL